MKPLRVCLIGPGANVHVRRWVAALRQYEIGVSLISTTPASTPSRIPTYEIPTTTAGMRPSVRFVTLLRGWARVPALLRALNPDLTHIHSLPVPAAVPFLVRMPRLVVSAWGSDVAQRDRRKAQWYPHLLGHAARITATSQYLADVTASYLRAPRLIEVVPFGVDPQQFQPALVPPGELRLGTLRHLEANYGLDVLIAATPRLLHEFPQAQIEIAGDGSLRDALQRQIRTLGVTKHVRLLGRIAHEAAPDFLRSLSLFVNPSRAESFGVAALEAQACCLPVVASRVGGLPEVVRDGVTGLLIPPDDPHALAEAVLMLLGNAELRTNMGHAARRWVVERYNWDANVRQMIAVYEDVRR